MSSLCEFLSLHTTRKSFQSIQCPVSFSCFEITEQITFLSFVLSSVISHFDESAFLSWTRNELLSVPSLMSRSVVACCLKVLDGAPRAFIRRIAFLSVFLFHECLFTIFTINRIDHVRLHVFVDAILVLERKTWLMVVVMVVVLWNNTWQDPDVVCSINVWTCFLSSWLFVLRMVSQHACVSSSAQSLLLL
jgi:hypothetical protein